MLSHAAITLPTPMAGADYLQERQTLCPGEVQLLRYQQILDVYASMCVKLTTDVSTFALAKCCSAFKMTRGLIIIDVVLLTLPL